MVISCGIREGSCAISFGDPASVRKFTRLVLMLALVTMAWTSPAAAVSGLVPVNGTPTASDSSTTKTATVSCTGSKKVYGTGAIISGGNGRVLITSIVPNTLLTSVTVTASEDRNSPSFTGVSLPKRCVALQSGT